MTDYVKRLYETAVAVLDSECGVQSLAELQALVDAGPPPSTPTPPNGPQPDGHMIVHVAACPVCYPDTTLDPDDESRDPRQHAVAMLLQYRSEPSNVNAVSLIDGILAAARKG